MKLLIADDMEGISGVVDFSHVSSDHPEYQRFRRIMTGDVNAAIRGAFAGGATEVIISDGHGGAKNVLIEELDERAKLNTGSGSPFAMMQGVDQDVDAVIFVGYHAMAGTAKAILAHTWSSVKVSNVWLNERRIGEIGLNATLAGHYQVPVLLITSDTEGCHEARDWISGIKTVAVKEGNSRAAAECFTPAAAQRMIEEAVKEAIEKYLKGEYPLPLAAASPVTIKVEFKNAGMADSISKMMGIRRLDGQTIEYTSQDFPEAYKTFGAVVSGANG
jgi:D-amino peptidase